MKTKDENKIEDCFSMNSSFMIFPRIVIVMALSILSWSGLHAQYSQLPSLVYPLENNYSYEQTKLGYFMNLNYAETTDIDKAIFGLAMGKVERYRFCQNGTFALTNIDKEGRISFFNQTGLDIGFLSVSPSAMNLTFKDGWSKKPFGSLVMTQVVTALISASDLQLGAYDKVKVIVNNNEVQSSIPYKMQNGDVTLVATRNDQGSAGWIGTVSNNGLHLGTNGNSQFFIDNSQNVYIGMSKEEANRVKAELRSKYNLFVRQGILSEDYAIAPQSTWSDFVFNTNYNLPQLHDVESFINENNHLPDVPSAKQVAEEGYSQHEINRVLLQKIEELTLYTIKQEKEIQTLKKELNNRNK